MEDKPLSLREQCFLHLVSHVMEYSPQELALLPEHHRHALLRVIAPVHLYWLEQTAVANGIDTDAIWKEVYQLQSILPVDRRNWCPATVTILDSYKDGLGAQYVTYIWHTLVGDLAEEDLYHHNNRIKMIFATHTKMLEDSTAEFLKSHTQPWFVPVMLKVYNNRCDFLAPAHCLVTSDIGAAACLIEMGALPRVLDISIGYIQSSALGQQKANRLLQQLLQNSQLRTMRMDFSRGDPYVGTVILQTVLQREVSTLQSLELLNLHINVPSPLVPLVSTPECYSGLKDLHVELCVAATTTAVQYDLFASIVTHQTALESLYLTQLGHFPMNTVGERFVLALTSLLGQPQFKRLRLCGCEGLPLAALQAITEAFMNSSPQGEQHLTLVSVKVVILSRWKALLHSSKYQHLSVSTEHAAAVGPRKYLCFHYSHIPCPFFKWFCGMKYLCLNTLEIIRCRTDNSKCTIREHFEQHPNFNIQYFRCS